MIYIYSSSFCRVGTTAVVFVCLYTVGLATVVLIVQREKRACVNCRLWSSHRPTLRYVLDEVHREVHELIKACAAGVMHHPELALSQQFERCFGKQKADDDGGAPTAA